MLYLVVFLGAGLGGAFRLGINELAARLLGIEFPFGTLIINVLGAFIMGLLTEYFAFRGGMSQEMRLFLTTGLLGGFTTFSTFALESVMLWERGQQIPAIAYIALSVFLSIAALMGGLAIVRLIIQAQTV
ncbi:MULTISPECIES: fluoride efflux transporter CrcB [unclassified Rhizobium]|uniref:fluoride efflux transporter CrcB n=1 Tax=Rhizobium TaxID=379 RepID=UPI00084CADA3|nr:MULTISPECIES: fluoride efflux transporter CrcB [unclassified Rhizobium]OEC98495.1 protein CrcB [Rhizobium sp. YK2]QYA10989.1 fluoride efflux transporter CrcB [Rhizobium sp. AB2/73]UEQ79480.1 fluoride efflux transporter CrcB [Rhizobium sp. AB2/73]